MHVRDPLFSNFKKCKYVSKRTFRAYCSVKEDTLYNAKESEKKYVYVCLCIDIHT